jgi:transposase
VVSASTLCSGAWNRKISFGTRSAQGSRFIERILTVVTTLKQQKRNTLEFLREALWAHRRGQSPPSLLPVSEPSQAAA